MTKLIARLSGWLAAGLLMIGLATASAAQADNEAVQTTWRLLDYIAVDYPGAVVAGHVKSASEYAEQIEFSKLVHDGIAAMPASAARAKLVAEATSLESSIAAKEAASAVAERARRLGDHLLVAYPVALAPSKLPDSARGATLYAANCASCHGLTGNGRGPLAASLTPPPIAFTDVERARERSSFALYQVISQGLDGTAMPGFSNLSTADRWALAFHAGRFAFSDTAAGERIWRTDKALRQRFPDLAALTSITPAALAAAIGPAKADAVIAHLRANPGAVTMKQAGSLAVARTALQQTLAAYAAGDTKAAQRLALSAYLDGFEPLEPTLTARDATLMSRIERAMGELRGAVSHGASVDTVRTQVAVLETLFLDADAALAPGASSQASTFLGAFTILLREGLEALLIVIAMIAFLRKADRQDALPYVHGGWVAALLAGVLTWAAATYVIGVSGASRELTEGFGSLFAAVVLLSVGIWMHGKSRADEWQRYIRQTLGKALSRGSSWFLFGLAFIVVYREVFETILFYASLWTQGNGGVVLAGAASAIAVLAFLAWAMLRFSGTLPIGKFFAYSSALIAVLAVVLAGKGVSALQEAGWIDIAPLANFPRIQLLGILPTVQSLGAQAVAIGMIVLGLWFNSRRSATKTAVQPAE